MRPGGVVWGARGFAGAYRGRIFSVYELLQTREWYLTKQNKYHFKFIYKKTVKWLRFIYLRTYVLGGLYGCSHEKQDPLQYFRHSADGLFTPITQLRPAICRNPISWMRCNDHAVSVNRQTGHNVDQTVTYP